MVQRVVIRIISRGIANLGTVDHQILMEEQAGTPVTPSLRLRTTTRLI